MFIPRDGSTPPKAIPVVVVALALLAGGSAKASLWIQGDVFVTTEALDQEPNYTTATIRVYSNMGVFKQEILNTSFDRDAFQCAFSPTLDRLYVPVVDDGSPSGVALATLAFNNAHPHALVSSVGPAGPNSGRGVPASVVTRPSDRHIFVGYRDLASEVYEYDANNVFVTKYQIDTLDAKTGATGAGFIDLSTDGRTIFYTDRGLVRRFDVVANAQLPNFALVAHSDTRSLRLLSPGNGTGGLLVSDGVQIERLDQNGQLVRTYNYNPPFGGRRWLALDLDPNRTSFWALARAPSSGGITNHNSELFRFNILSGVIEVGPVRVFSGTALCVKGGASAKLAKKPRDGIGQPGTAGANGRPGQDGPDGQPVGTPVP